MPYGITSVTCHPQGWIDLGTAVSVTCILYVGNVFVHASVNTAIYTGVCLYSSDLTCHFYDHELSCMLFRPAVIDFAMCSLWSVMCKRLKWNKISVLYLGVVCSHMQSDCATVIVNVSTTRAFLLHNTFAVAWSRSVHLSPASVTQHSWIDWAGFWHRYYPRLVLQRTWLTLEINVFLSGIVRQTRNLVSVSLSSHICRHSCMYITLTVFFVYVTGFKLLVAVGLHN